MTLTHVTPPTATPTAWPPGPKSPNLATDQVHIWLANLDAEVFSLPKFLRDLSLSERARAQNLRFEHNRRRYVVAKGLLRRILGGYLRINACDVEFSIGRWGKPELSPRMLAQHGRLSFNQAHSGPLGIFAVSWNRAVGVDVEEIRPLAHFDQTAELFFTKNELELFQSLPVESRQRAFFDGWTRKESFVKALGAGLSLPLDHFEVPILPGQSAKIIQTQDDPPQTFQWSLTDVPISPRFAAAVCAEGIGWRPLFWKWRRQG